MDYCSYEDAFPQIGPSSTGCKGQTASEVARKEERRKAKKCKGPPLTFLDLDPDRPAVQRPPEVPPLNPSTGLRESSPMGTQPAEPFTDVSGPGDRSRIPIDLRSQYQPNDAGQVARNTFPRVSGPDKLPKPACSIPSYFGASVDSEEGFQGFMGTFGKSTEKSVAAPHTDVIGDDTNYRLYPDFLSAFQRVTGTEAVAGKSLAPVPSVSNEWKPLTPAGARTAFFDELPPPGGQYPKGTKVVAAQDPEMIQKKFDVVFARLDELQSRRGENTQTEILLFVMSGLFVIFGMDIISRNAARIRLR